MIDRWVSLKAIWASVADYINGGPFASSSTEASGILYWLDASSLVQWPLWLCIGGRAVLCATIRDASK
jgi:hypothetical protein